MKALIIMMALFLLLLASGCAALPSLMKPVLEEEGEVFVYLQPFPQEAARLQFSIDHLSAVRSDGAEFPLPLSLAEFKQGEVRRQRLIATGILPPGQYQGLSYTVTKASLTGEEGEANLLVPEEPVKIPFPFNIRRKKALVLSLVFRYAESVQSGFSFTPGFHLVTPPMPAIGLVGYVVNPGNNTITVFDKKSGQVASIMAMGKGPQGVAFDRSAGKAYVSLEGEDAIEVIDVTAESSVNRINLKVGDGPREISLTPDGRFLLIVNAGSRTLSIVDPLSLVELNRVPVGEGPRSLLVGPGGTRCYVFNGLSNTLSVIDIPNSATVATISTEPGPLMGQFNRKGDQLYVIHEGSPYLWVFDPASLSVVKRVFVGSGISFIKLDTATDRIYGYRKLDVRVEVYDPFSLLPAEYITATSGIVYMTIDGEENNLYLVSAEKNLLMTVNLISRKIVSETDVGENPARVTMMGER
ncbi:MAG TPA: YncE family protein [Nitrospirota bacterium]|nr:YncE family protein [Nitrospirota bacterium]